MSSFGCSLKQAWGTDCLDACPSSSSSSSSNKPPRVREIRDNARSHEYPAISPSAANPSPTTTVKKRVVNDQYPSTVSATIRTKKHDPNDDDSDSDDVSSSSSDHDHDTLGLGTLASDRLVRGLLMGGVALFALDAAFRMGQATAVKK